MCGHMWACAWVCVPKVSELECVCEGGRPRVPWVCVWLPVCCVDSVCYCAGEWARVSACESGKCPWVSVCVDVCLLRCVHYCPAWREWTEGSLGS